MKTTWLGGIALTLLLFFSVVATLTAAECRAPGIRFVSEKPIKVRFDLWEIGSRVALVGYKEELDNLRPHELRQIETSIHEIINEYEMRLWAEALTETFRARVVSKINSDLGRGQVVWDVVFAELSLVEYRPAT
jgi:hypothetical protein